MLSKSAMLYERGLLLFAFDTRTSIIIYSITNILLAFVIYKTWLQNRGKYDGLTFWLADYILQAIGIILAVMRGTIPDIVSIVIANLFMIAGAMLFMFGFGRFIGVNVKKVPNYICLAVFLMSYYYFGIVHPFIPLRIIIFSSCFIFISAQVVWLAFVKSGKHLMGITKSTGIIFIMFIAVDILRIILAFTVPHSRSYFLGNSNDTIFTIFSQMLSISLTFSITLMINRRLFLEIKRQSKEKEELLSNMRRLATIDGLTGVFNRMKIEEILSASASLPDAAPLSIILVDVDNFKAVNDTYGHSMGDSVLKTLSSILSKNIRDTDSLGRWGGEEFLIITPSTNLHTSHALAQRLTSLVADYKFTDIGQVTVSMGLSTLAKCESFSEMLKNADKALYRAKANGRNRVEIFSYDKSFNVHNPLENNKNNKLQLYEK